MSDRPEVRITDGLAPEQLFDLTDRVALVAGAAGGMGRFLVAGLLQAGARVVASDREPAALEQLRADLADPAGLSTLPSDLSDPSAPAELVDRTVTAAGRIDVLVNAAAINVRRPLREVDQATYRAIMQVDLDAAFFLAQAAVEPMIEQGRGSIVTISSVNAMQGIETVGVYGPAKAALVQLTKVMAVEWSHLGIRANAIAPGFADTPLTIPLQADERRMGWLLDRIPMRRLGDPREFVGPMLLLASDAGSYLNGATLTVDGGFLAGSRWDG